VKEAMGLVLVLIPGDGSGWARRTPTDGPNYFARRAADESPVHEVELSPYFLSKYEMTQGQWSRFAGRNPSEHGPATNYNGTRPTSPSRRDRELVGLHEDPGAARPPAADRGAVGVRLSRGDGHAVVDGRGPRDPAREREPRGSGLRARRRA
jgi:formylglycine-generating enzyme required for sulfatase activity